MEIQDLAGQYQSRTDEELLRLALDPEQLTPEANAVLNDELGPATNQQCRTTIIFS